VKTEGGLGGINHKTHLSPVLSCLALLLPFQIKQRAFQLNGTRNDKEALSRFIFEKTRQDKNKKQKQKQNKQDKMKRQRQHNTRTSQDETRFLISTMFSCL
jgi:hypothetical protein